MEKGIDHGWVRQRRSTQFDSSQHGWLLEKEEREALVSDADLKVWEAYANDRSHVQPTPYLEAAAIITRNRDAILRDLVKQSTQSKWNDFDLPETAEAAEASLVALVETLREMSENPGSVDFVQDSVLEIARFLDTRMCVPRDMGAMAAGTIKTLASKKTATAASGG